MAVEQTGSVVDWGSTADTDSQALTIPADCTGVEFWAGAFRNSPAMDMQAVSIGGNAMTPGAEHSAGGQSNANVWYLVNPPTGATSLTWTWNIGPVAGARFAVRFLRGINTADPIVDVVAAFQAPEDDVTYTLDAVDDGYVSGWGTCAAGQGADTAPAGSDQTEDAAPVETNGLEASLGHANTVGAPTTDFRVVTDGNAAAAVISWRPAAEEAEDMIAGGAMVSH